MTTQPTLAANRVDETTRARVIVVVCAVAAISGGAWAATSNIESAGVVLFGGAFALAALILPRAWIPLALVAFIPFQFYLPVAGGLNLRGASIFVIVAAFRFLLPRLAAGNVWRWRAWMIPAALFIVAAGISALGAANRYVAFKGIYDWLSVFAAAFVVGEAVQTERWLKRIVVALVLVGASEAVLGIAQSSTSVSQIAQALQSPLSGIVYQPNLLRDRLADMSFNWVLDGRVVPFGTFINGIDYAILLAAIVPLGFALILDARGAARKYFWFVVVCVTSVALLMTFKGSGLIALAGGLVAFAFVYARRFNARARLFGLGVVIVGGLLALTIEPVAQRILFLFQREAGMLSGTGRVAIWMQLLAALPRAGLFGFGLNNAGGLIDPLPSLRGGEFVLVSTAPESAYVAALIETGVLGFVALITFIGVVTWRAYRNAHVTGDYPYLMWTQAASLRARLPATTESDLVITRHANVSATCAGVLAAIVALWCGNLTVTGLTTDQNGLLLGVLIGMVFSSANPCTARKGRCDANGCE